MSYDAIVVGGGTAGLSAAMWIGRYRRKVLVVDSGEYRNRWVERVHGFLGDDPVEPGELLDRARRDLRQYPTVELRRGRVRAARAEDSGTFAVEVETGDADGASSSSTSSGDRVSSSTTSLLPGSAGSW